MTTESALPDIPLSSTQSIKKASTKRARKSRSGQGSVVQRGPDIWELTVTLGTDEVTGQQMRRSRRFRGSKPEATRALTSFLLDVRDGKITRDRSTFADLAEEWIATFSAHQWQPSTLRYNRRTLEAYVLGGPAGIGRITATKLVTRDLDRLYVSLKHDRHLDASTIRKAHGVVRAVLNFGERQGVLRHNVSKAAQLGPASKREARWPPDDAVFEALDAAERSGPMWHAFTRIAAYCGTRPQETCALRWRDVDLERTSAKGVPEPVIHVRRALKRGATGYAVGSTKTRDTRRIDIDGDTAEVIATWHTAAEKQSAGAGGQLIDDDYLFCPSRAADFNAPITPPGAGIRWASIVAGTAAEGFTLYALRHWHATWCLRHMAQLGLSLNDISHRLGHANTTMLLEVYGHAMPSSGRAIADGLAAFGRARG